MICWNLSALGIHRVPYEFWITITGLQWTLGDRQRFLHSETITQNSKYGKLGSLLGSTTWWRLTRVSNDNKNSCVTNRNYFVENMTRVNRSRMFYIRANEKSSLIYYLCQWLKVESVLCYNWLVGNAANRTVTLVICGLGSFF